MATRTDRLIGAALSEGRYLVDGKLGEGGMAAVYRARDRNLGANVVVKVPHRAMLEDPGFVRRFQVEIEALVRLVHPHIVRITDVGTHGELPFAVMQFLGGGSLEDHRGRDRGPGRRPSAPLRSWLPTVAAALDFIHGRGYVHRDVKPANILFDDQRNAYLGDFGVIKVVTSSAGRGPAGLTGTGMVLGTAEYMAPEVIMGDPFDGRADQYALAVTAFELLVGRRPFEADVATRVLVQHTTVEPPSPHELCDGVTPATSAAVLRGLAKDPAARYPDCAALARAVLDTMPAGPGAAPTDEAALLLSCTAAGRG